MYRGYFIPRRFAKTTSENSFSVSSPTPLLSLYGAGCAPEELTRFAESACLFAISLATAFTTFVYDLTVWAIDEGSMVALPEVAWA